MRRGVRFFKVVMLRRQEGRCQLGFSGSSEKPDFLKPAFTQADCGGFFRMHVDAHLCLYMKRMQLAQF